MTAPRGAACIAAGTRDAWDAFTGCPVPIKIKDLTGRDLAELGGKLWYARSGPTGGEESVIDEHPNILLVKEALEAFTRGDVAEVKAFLAEDILWHVPGRGRLAGDYTGLEEAFEFFSEAGGPRDTTQFSFNVHKMIGSDDFVSMFVRYHHERADEAVDQDGIELFRVEAGKIQEFWAFIRDSRSFDEFFR